MVVRQSTTTSGTTASAAFDHRRDPAWQPVLDGIWLRALCREGARLDDAFLSLLTTAPIDAVLRFLDKDVGTRDLVEVVRALPPRPFVRALLS